MATTLPPLTTLLPNVTAAVKEATSNLGFVAGDDVINSKIALLILQALIIISFARLLGWLFSFIKEPMVIAEMVAGILLGPTVMGRIPGFTVNIFPPESLPLLQICSQLGLLLFMFVVGLELDIELLRKKVKAAVVASVAGVCVPMLIAVPLMFLFYKPEFLGHDHHVSRGAFTLFLGIVLSISALPVLARIMSEYNFMNSGLGVFTMTATTVDDMIAWPLLALAIALAGAKKSITVLWIILLVGANFIFLFCAVRPAYKLIARFAAQRGVTQTTLFLSLVVLFALSFFCEISGLTYLVGAFQCGLMVPRENGLASKIAQKIEHIVVVVFMPLFFAMSGLRTQFAVLNTARLWGLTILLTVCSIFGKLTPCIPCARWVAKLSWRDSIAFGVLMNTKGLVALISINLGIEYSIISSLLFAQLLIMVLINTCITTPLIALLDCILPAPVPEAPASPNRDVALLYVPGDSPHTAALVHIARTLHSVDRICDLLLFRLLDAEEPSVYIPLSRRDVAASTAKALARRYDVVMKVQYESSSDPVSKLLRAAEHASFIFAALPYQALGGDLVAALRHTRRSLFFLVEPAIEAIVPSSESEQEEASSSVPRRTSGTTLGEPDTRVRLLMPCLHDRLADVESVLEIVLRMLRGSQEVTLLFVHIVPNGQAELLRQQGRLLLRLLVARGIQVVWRETEDPLQFAVLQSEVVMQRATHVVLPMDGMPASWAEQITTLTVPLLLVRPEEQKAKNLEDTLL